jgi:hypothetical protein
MTYLRKESSCPNNKSRRMKRNELFMWIPDPRYVHSTNNMSSPIPDVEDLF